MEGEVEDFAPCFKNCYTRDLRNSTMDKAFVLQAVNPDSLPGIPI